MNSRYEKALNKILNSQKNKIIYYSCCNNSLITGPTGAQGQQGVQGLQGPTGPTGPEGITGPTGPQGEPGPTGPSGTGVTIMGSYDTLDELIANHPIGNIGDSYLVGDNLYVWSSTDNKWIDVGIIRGPVGEIGPTGPQGPRGEIGPTGPQGQQGIQGPEGPRGESGYALLSAYGGKYNNMTTSLQSQGFGNWIQVPLTSSMSNINIVQTEDNTITLEQDGVYEINYFINISVDKATTLTLIVRNNSTNIPSTVITKQIVPNMTISYNGSVIVNLNANDKLDMEISTNEQDVTINFANGTTAALTVKKIDELE